MESPLSHMWLRGLFLNSVRSDSQRIHGNESWEARDAAQNLNPSPLGERLESMPGKEHRHRDGRRANGVVRGVKEAERCG